MLTKKNIDDDLVMIMEAVKHVDAPIPSAKEALKISVKLPVLSALPYIFVLLMMSTLDDYSGETLVIVLFHFLVIGMFTLVSYGTILLLLSVPVEARNRSILFKLMKDKFSFMAKTLISLNVVLMASSYFYPQMIFISPVFVFVSNMIFRVCIGLELSRYGIASILDKIGSVVRAV